jgi:hypothetical protein
MMRSLFFKYHFKYTYCNPSFLYMQYVPAGFAMYLTGHQFVKLRTLMGNNGVRGAITMVLQLQERI